jgi:hypothetical protein
MAVAVAGWPPATLVIVIGALTCLNRTTRDGLTPSTMRCV